MADPARNDDPLSSMRFSSDSPSSAPRSLDVKSEPVALLPEDTPSRPLGEWPRTDITEAAFRENSRLESAGEAVGTALGRSVNEARELSGRVQDRVRDMKTRLMIVARRRTDEVKEKTSELATEAEQKVSELADEAMRQARNYESRARLFARGKPYELIGGAAAAGFAIGFLLRLWGDE